LATKAALANAYNDCGLPSSATGNLSATADFLASRTRDFSAARETPPAVPEFGDRADQYVVSGSLK
jgi:hypothetical protein